MGKILLFLFGIGVSATAFSQDLKAKDIPAPVKETLSKKFPAAAKVSWELEKGNYEANWGGKSGEDHSAQFTPSGVFIEIVDNVPVSSLPTVVTSYVSKHYNTPIREAGKLTDTQGKCSYEVEIKGKALAFGLDGKFEKELP
jgi:hypothetical protein